jgi:hypothetical protein
MSSSSPHRPGPDFESSEAIRDKYFRQIEAEKEAERTTNRLRDFAHLMPPLPASRPKQKAMLLTADPVERKGIPMTTGVLDYFPLAIAEVAKVSKAGNDQHNPGQPLHWDKTKSLDHADCISRHLIDRGSRDSDGMRHSAKLVWRALALLQTELENEAKEAA